MQYVDYNWELRPNMIILDHELNTDELGWKCGDFFRFENRNGKQVLVKVDPLIPFIQGHKQNTP
jgi:hypothetical protein